MSEHTPTPWAIDGDDEGFDGIPYIEISAGTCGTPSYKSIALVQPTFHPGTDDFVLEAQDRANAAFIVRAVNSFDDLLSALKLLEKRCGPNATDGAIARAAIAKAESTK